MINIRIPGEPGNEASSQAFNHLTRWKASLGTRPSKNRKGGSGTSAGVEVYTAPGMKAHFRLAFD